MRDRLLTVDILAGAERMQVYLPLLKGKKIGVFANQTSMVGKTHLVDTLKKSGILCARRISVSLRGLVG